MGATYRVRRRKSAHLRGELAHFAGRSAHFSWRSAHSFRRSAHSCDGPLTSSGAALAFRTALLAPDDRPLTPTAGLLTFRAGLNAPAAGDVRPLVECSRVAGAVTFVQRFGSAQPERPLPLR